MAFDEDAYETTLDVPSGKYGKLIAVPGVPIPGPPGPQGEPGPTGPPGPAEGVEFQDNKGQPDGYAPLGADGLVPAENLPLTGSNSRTPLPGAKVRGGNITVKPGYDWRHLWSEWDWDNWIKPQIDRAVVLGLNTIRFIGGASVITNNRNITWTAWAASTAYTVDTLCTKDGNVYHCVGAGTSGTTGPSGTGTNITDGTAKWNYVRANDLTPITQEVYDQRWEQVADYCNSKGLALYPCLTQIYDFPTGSYRDAATTASIVTTAEVLNKHNNVIAFDLFQEGDWNSGLKWEANTAYGANVNVYTGGKTYKSVTAGTSGTTGPTGSGTGITDGTVVWDYYGVNLYPEDVLALMAAVRKVSGVPLTMSSAYPSSGSAFWNQYPYIWKFVHSDPAGSDFIDVHMYDAALSYITVEKYADYYRKPILIGEFGTTQADDAATQSGKYKAASDTHERPGVMGSLVWALADQGASAARQAGVWDNTGFAQGVSPLSTTAGQRTGLVSSVSNLAVTQPASKTLVNPRITTQINDINDKAILAFAPAANAVNYFRIDNAASGGPSINTVGASTEVPITFVPKGTLPTLDVWAGSASTVQLRVAGSGAAVNLDLKSGGTGRVRATGMQLTDPLVVNAIKDSNGNNAIALGATANAVNYPKFNNAAAGGVPSIDLLASSDTNVGLTLLPKGSGRFTMYMQAGQPTATIGTSGADAAVGLDIATKGNAPLTVNSLPVGQKVAVPSASSSAGKPGQWAANATHMFVYTGDGTNHSWGRVALETTWAVTLEGMTAEEPVEGATE